jgi:hypothetical protein
MGDSTLGWRILYKDFHEAIGSEAKVLNLLGEVTIVHPAYGEGCLRSFTPRPRDATLVELAFSENANTKIFHSDNFGAGTEVILVPGSPAMENYLISSRERQECIRKAETRKVEIEKERIYREQQIARKKSEQMEREKRERDERDTYEKMRREDDGNRIINQIARKQTLSVADKEAIDILGIQREVAIVYEEIFRSEGAAWSASAASRWWRAAGDARRAIDITSESIKTSGSHSKQVWTSRAAACWDEGVYEEGRRAIERAMELEGVDEYIQRFLMRISGALGEVESLESNLQVSRRLGLSDFVISKTLREGLDSPIQNDDQESARKRMANRLLKIDSVRFSWASAYV